MQLLKKVNVHIKHRNSPVKSHLSFPPKHTLTLFFYFNINKVLLLVTWPNDLQFYSLTLLQVWWSNICKAADCTSLPMERSYVNLPLPPNLSTNKISPSHPWNWLIRKILKHDLPRYWTHQHWWNTKASKRSKIITF